MAGWRHPAAEPNVLFHGERREFGMFRCSRINCRFFVRVPLFSSPHFMQQFLISGIGISNICRCRIGPNFESNKFNTPSYDYTATDQTSFTQNIPHDFSALHTHRFAGAAQHMPRFGLPPNTTRSFRLPVRFVAAAAIATAAADDAAVADAASASTATSATAAVPAISAAIAALAAAAAASRRSAAAATATDENPRRTSVARCSIANRLRNNAV